MFLSSRLRLGPPRARGGAVELAGAIGLLIPRLAGAAALGLIGVMVGAVITQLFVLEPVWALLPTRTALARALTCVSRCIRSHAALLKLRCSLFAIQAAHTVYELGVSEGLGRADYAAIA